MSTYLLIVAVAGFVCGVIGKRWLIIIGLLLCAAYPFAANAAIPAQAQQYQRTLTREAQRVWGLDAPVARFAAQVHQESGWRADAKSKYAAGLAQFTPDTAKWIAQVYPVEFDGVAAPYSPGWALRALVVYDRHLYVRTKGHTDCDRWHFTLRGYNGGAANLLKESRNAADPLCAASVAVACGTARRSAKHCPENLGYPQRILYRWEPEYRAAGWHGEAVCH